MLRTKHLLLPLACLLWLPLFVHAQGATAARTAAGVTAAQVSAHEQQLAAIRQALIDATLEAPTQVVSTSWIDHMGVLREDHQFNSKAEVRGVRLFSFGKDEAAEARPKVSADVLPWAWRQDPAAGEHCAAAPRSWRLPLHISAELASGFSGPQRAAAQGLLQGVEGQVHALVRQGTRWTPAESAVRPGNTYLQALSAPATDGGSGWQLGLKLVADAARLAPGAPSLQTGAGGIDFFGPAPWVWTLQLSLHNTAGQATPDLRWEQSYRIPLDIGTLAEHPSRWRAPLEAELTQRLAVWLQGVEARLRCEPTPFLVRQDASGMRLAAGQDSGLRSGDRVLIMQPGWVPGRLLDPRVTDHLALAEVVRTGRKNTEIRQLAGPPLAPGNDWVALPL